MICAAVAALASALVLGQGEPALGSPPHPDPLPGGEGNGSTAPPSPTADPPTGVLTKPPVLKRFVEAEYPPDALASGVTGSVLLSVVIDDRGEVTRVVVDDPGPGPTFATAALHAVAQFDFEPAEIDGKPAAVEIAYRYEFVIRKAPVAPPAEAPVSLFGRVVERGTRSPLVGAAVDAGGVVAETDAAGRFELRGLAPGPVTVRIVSPDHDTVTVEERIEAGRKKEVEYRLTRRHYDPFEAVVQGDRERKEVTVHTLRLEEVRSLPGTQGDTLKVLQNFPGVARSPFGLGLLVVRGSAPADTKVYLDGVEIPLLFHFGGLTSVISSEVLSTLDFYPGNFGARFGRAMGGAVDVHTRDGKKEFHGDAQLDIFDGQLLLEGPVGDGTVYVAARRSWVDQVLSLALPRIAPQAANDLRVAPRYYDYQARLTYPLWGGTASLMVYGTDDALDFVRPEDRRDRPSLYLETLFARVAARHTRTFGSSFANDLTIAYGHDRVDVLQASNFGVLTGIDSVTLRDAFTIRRSDRLSFELGTDTVLRRFDYSLYAPPLRPPGTLGGFGDSATELPEKTSGNWLAPALYAEADWRPLAGVRIVPGLRLDGDSRLERGKIWVDPRLSVFYEVRPGTTLSVAAGLYGEPPQPQELTRLFGNPALLPQRAAQYSVGLVQDLPWSSRLELTGFYKDLRDLVTPTRALAPDGTLLHLSNGGIGEVYGAELLLRRELAQGLYGWLAYTYSVSSRRDDPTIPGFPQWHLFELDQTHIFTLVLSYRAPGGFIIGTRIRAASGNPYTPTASSIMNTDTGRYQCLAAERPFSARLPGFFQADARIDKRFVFDHWMFSMYLDVQNATNRDNAEFRFQNYDCTEQVPVPGLPIFPALGLRAEW